jgi:hypothetical protein
MTPAGRIRAVGFILAGVALLVLKQLYHGPLAEPVHFYAGNLGVSFAVYFLVAVGGSRVPLPRWAIALIALLAVETFELTNGFGIMSNVYDPLDLVANALGIGVALLVDRVRTPDPTERSHHGYEHRTTGESPRGR